MAKFTFCREGKYPVSDNGKVEWLSTREKAEQYAKWFGGEVVELTDEGHIVDPDRGSDQVQ